MSNRLTTLITTASAEANIELRLSICLRPNGFSFSIATTEQILLSFGEAEFDFTQSVGTMTSAIKQFFADNGISTFDYKQVRLIVPSEHFVWIPAHLYDASRDQQYLNIVSKPDESLGICHAYSEHLDSNIVFSVPFQVVTSFKVAIPGIDVVCQHSLLANNMLKQRSVQHPVILMHVRDGVGDFEAFYGGQLLLSNTFGSANSNELIYHAIDLMKKLHLETPDLEFSICGDVDREFYGVLQHYFPTVTLYTGLPFTYTNSEFQVFHSYRHALLLP